MNSLGASLNNLLSGHALTNHSVLGARWALALIPLTVLAQGTLNGFQS